MNTKVCTKCHKEYPATREYFALHKGHKDGFAYHCKICKYAATAAWQKKNKEKRNNWMRKHYRTLRGYVNQLVKNIKQRCNNPKTHNYKNYGGRGIECVFTTGSLYNWFVEKKINPKGLEIHRINNDGNYTLDNIEFLDKSTHMKLHHSQNRN